MFPAAFNSAQLFWMPYHVLLGSRSSSGCARRGSKSGRIEIIDGKTSGRISTANCSLFHGLQKPNCALHGALAEGDLRNLSGASKTPKEAASDSLWVSGTSLHLFVEAINGTTTEFGLDNC
jgi:hypothetical protein